MAGTGPIYVPNIAAAQGPAFTGMSVQDSVTVVTYDAELATAQHVPYMVQNEIRNLIRLAYAGGIGIQIRNASGATLPAGPVSLSGHYAVDAVTGNAIYYVQTANSFGDTPANGLLLSALANATSGTAVCGGVFTSTLNTTNSFIGAPVYLAYAGGLTLSLSESENFKQVVGFVQTLATAGVINGLIQAAAYVQAAAEEESGVF